MTTGITKREDTMKKEIESVNRFKLVGNLDEVKGDKAIITTVVPGVTGRAYTNTFPIEVSTEQAEMLAPLQGTTVGVIGHVEKTLESQTAWLKALEVKALPNAAHSNRAEFTGPVYGADIMGRTDGKRQMANITFVIGSRVVNAVSWRGAVTELRHKNVRRDSIVTLKGRVRLREYEQNGELYETIELTCDQSADVKVHYVPDDADDFTFDAAEKPAGTAPAAPIPAGRNPSRRSKARAV
jgi:hypothetical protein